MSLTLLGHVDLAEGRHAAARERFAEAVTLFQAIGNLMYLPWCLEGLAGVAAARGRHQLAAELDGVREAAQAQLSMMIPPVHLYGYARTVASVRDALTQEAFHAARAVGHARPVEQIIAAALTDG